MSKIRYKYNTKTLSYEKAVTPLRTRIFRAISFLGTASVIGVISVIIAFRYFDSPKEKQLRRELEKMQIQYDLLNKRMNNLAVVLDDLEQRDDNVYRAIFEAEPIPDDIRKSGFGGADRYNDLEGFTYSQLMISTTQKMDQLAKQMYIQSKSYDEVVKLAENKEKLLSSIPSIMPISVKDLKGTPSGFGYRTHPIYKIVKMHTGMDFNAAIGTPIYATGDGVVERADAEASGYGNHVVINHGFGYETLYGHMSKIMVAPGQQVKRGEVIGLVGNTGTSSGPHVHYEVIRNGNKINPISYYFLDLSPVEYQQIIQQSSQSNQSFD
ncbi:MAG: M23 family metallopeptidase [Bacteroidia bacterium]|jgi:murein DD-endopeptidase MepM/ murein hydrolase activator NlpD|nr:M23 family metallopeptidase [Bacteroidia bacterium]